MVWLLVTAFLVGFVSGIAAGIVALEWVLNQGYHIGERYWLK